MIFAIGLGFVWKTYVLFWKEDLATSVVINVDWLGIFQDTNQISSSAERQRPWALIYLCFEREERHNFTTFLLQGHKMLLSKVTYADSLVLVT